MNAAEIAAVLAEHIQVSGFDEIEEWHAYGCDCGFSGNSDDDHRAHVAAAIADRLAAQPARSYCACRMPGCSDPNPQDTP